MSKVLPGIILTLMVLGLLPFALIARSRAAPSDALPPHLVLDMDKQPKFKAQRATPMFADNRSMRPNIEGTLAREDMGLRSEMINDPMNPHLIGVAGANESMQFADPTAYAAVMFGRIRPANMTDEDFNRAAPPKPDDAAIAADKTFYLAKIPAQFTVSHEFLKRG